MTEVTLSPSQLDLIISVIVVTGACLAFCIGWLCHENGGK